MNLFNNPEKLIRAIMVPNVHAHIHAHEAYFPKHETLKWKCPCADVGCQPQAAVCLTCGYKVENSAGYADSCLSTYKERN